MTLSITNESTKVGVDGCQSIRILRSWVKTKIFFGNKECVSRSTLVRPDG